MDLYVEIWLLIGAVVIFAGIIVFYRLGSLSRPADKKTYSNISLKTGVPRKLEAENTIRDVSPER
jgi:hypothetical protein